jgi:hypothetical protein
MMYLTSHVLDDGRIMSGGGSMYASVGGPEELKGKERSSVDPSIPPPCGYGVVVPDRRPPPPPPPPPKPKRLLPPPPVGCG